MNIQNFREFWKIALKMQKYSNYTPKIQLNHLRISTAHRSLLPGGWPTKSRKCCKTALRLPRIIISDSIVLTIHITPFSFQFLKSYVDTTLDELVWKWPYRALSWYNIRNSETIFWNVDGLCPVHVQLLQCLLNRFFTLRRTSLQECGRDK